MSGASRQNGVERLSGVSSTTAGHHVERPQGEAVACHADEHRAGAGIGDLDVGDHPLRDSRDTSHRRPNCNRPALGIVADTARDLRGDLNHGSAGPNRVWIRERAPNPERDDVPHQQIPPIAQRTVNSVGDWEASRRDHLGSSRARRRVRVAVVGGGIAGLEAARELRACGVRDITIYEDRPVEATPSHVAAGLIEPVAGTRDPAGAQLETSLFSRSIPAWSMRSRREPVFVGVREVDTYCSAKRPPLPWAAACRAFVCSTQTSCTPPTAAARRRDSRPSWRDPRFLAALRLLAGPASRSCADTSTNLERSRTSMRSSTPAASAQPLSPRTPRFSGATATSSRYEPVPGVERVFIDESRNTQEVSADPLGVNTLLYVIPREFDVVLRRHPLGRPDAEGIPNFLPRCRNSAALAGGKIDPRLAHATSRPTGASRPRRQAGVRLELYLRRTAPLCPLLRAGGSAGRSLRRWRQGAIGSRTARLGARRGRERMNASTTGPPPSRRGVL